MLTASSSKNIWFIIPYSILIIGFLINGWYFIASIKARQYYGNSFQPSNLLDVDISFLKDSDSLLKGYLIQWYDNAISHNNRLNKTRGDYVNISLIVAFSTLLLFGITYISVNFWVSSVLI